MVALAAAAAAGALAIFFYAARGGQNLLGIASHGLLVAGASGLIGGLVGFLFGIPRTLQGNEPLSGDKPQRVAYQANTNLEQISDWLTKILVGIGLIQLGKAPQQLGALADVLGPGFGGTDGSGSFALTVVLYFTVAGFLYGFLWTRLFLPGAFRTADLELIDERITQRADEQNARDVLAVTLVDRQLNPGPDVPLVEERQLVEAVKAASAPVKVQIFLKAQETRSANWRSNPDKMALVIPIFRALIASDTEHRFHRNHAQLGYALKDKEPPDWVGAEEELTKAINIRGDWRRSGWLFYEFNRAICRIARSQMFQDGKPSDSTEKSAILDDLRAAAQNDYLFSLIKEDPRMLHWLRLNKIELSQLRG